MPTARSVVGWSRPAISSRTSSDAGRSGAPIASDSAFCRSPLTAAFHFSTAGSMTQEVWPWATPKVEPSA